MSAQKSITRIHLSDKDVFLLAEYQTDFNLRLKILNIKENEAYVGQANDIELRSQAAGIRLSFTDFIQKATDALFQKNDLSHFLYCLDKNDDAYNFKWKSIDSEETIINLGSIEMKKRDFGCMLTEILLSLADEMQSLKSDVQHLNKELTTSKNQLSSALTKLSDSNSLKENVEKELYSKFTLILNEKKRKIKELEMNAKTKPSSSKNSVAKRKTVKAYVSSSESEEVDGELETHYPGPSNMTKRNSLPFYEEIKPITQSKIRNRKAPINKKICIPDHPAVRVPVKCDNGAEDSGSADSLMEFL